MSGISGVSRNEPSVRPPWVSYHQGSFLFTDTEFRKPEQVGVNAVLDKEIVVAAEGKKHLSVVFAEDIVDHP